MGGSGRDRGGTPGKQKFREKELQDIRGGIRTARTAKSALARMLPLINEDTVGIWGSVTETVGGTAQQLPVIRSIANIFDVTSKDKVTMVKEAKASFRANVAQLREFILNERGRLSDQDLDFTIKATGILDKTTDADSARNIVQNMMRIASEVETGLEQELRQGGIGQAGKRKITRRKDGGFDVTHQTPKNI